MSSPRPLALIAVIALAASILMGLSVHRVREERMGLTRDEGVTIESIGDLLRAAAWETRVALADLAFLEASVVFHRGLRSEDELDLEPTALHPWVPAHDHDLENTQEMMPWIWLTTALNPNHTRAYALGGFFLSWTLERPEQALEYLAEGSENNPEDGLIPYTMGRIRLSHLSDPETAVPHLRRAVECGIDDEEDLLAAVRYLAHALRLSGRWEEGLTLWEEQVRVHSDDPAYAHGAEIYRDLVMNEETRMLHLPSEISLSDLAGMEAMLCPFGDHDHEH
ncbi:hypothetical protein JXA47_17190, partial [Candidatus Sumerlaeota bacterium]|nr:hypothetical protein [Candidatus Sumerlaeota bacterium]